MTKSNGRFNNGILQIVIMLPCIMQTDLTLLFVHKPTMEMMLQREEQTPAENFSVQIYFSMPDLFMHLYTPILHLVPLF